MFLDSEYGHASASSEQDKRAYRRQIAEETLEILECGCYTCPSNEEGHQVILEKPLSQAIAGSFVIHEGDAIPQTEASQPQESCSSPPVFEFTSETSLAALYRLASQVPEMVSRAMLLNFASAKRPGGGFLGGAPAQEESLARSSGLYPCLAQFKDDMYASNRKDPHGCLYSHDMIFSPQVPFFRDDDGALAAQPVLCSVISAPAVNKGSTKGAARKKVEPVMRTRMVRILRLAAAQRLDVLILGAWGCGVFRNDPDVIAKMFQEVLELPEFSGSFKHIVFPIPDPKMLPTFEGIFGKSEEPGSATSSNSNSKSKQVANESWET